MGVADELARLIAHRDAGELTDEEFQAAKADLLAHPERVRAEPGEAEVETISPIRRRNRRRALFVAALIVVALVGWVVLSEATIGGAHLRVRVTSVAAPTPDLVRFHATLTNVGGQSAAGSCQVTVSLRGELGVSQLVSAPQTVQSLAPVPPGGSARISADVPVLAGDARRVTKRDLSFTCQ